MIHKLIHFLKKDVQSLNVTALIPAYLFMSGMMFIMTIINIITAAYPIAVATGVVSVWFLICLGLFKLTNSKHQLAFCMLLAIYGMMMYFVISGGVEGFSIVWLLVVPPAAMFCFSLIYGGIFSLLLGVSFTIYMIMPPVEWGYNYSQVYRQRFPIVYFFTTLICIFVQFLLVNSNAKRNMLIEELERANCKLETANRSKSDFLSNMSHEIRTPINAIIGMNEMVLRESDDEKIIEYANQVRSSSQSLLSIINDVLDISKIESGKIEIVEANYELSPLITDCYNMVIERVTEKKLTLHIACDEKIPHLLYGDVSRIRQIILNLLTNAVKYTEKGNIYLRINGVEQNNQWLLKVMVEDSGIGIAKENIDKLFGKFERFDLQKNRNIEGTGLGLNIVKSIVELMNGTISVESEYGKGSVFTVCVPQKIADIAPIGKIEVGSATTDISVYKHRCDFIAPRARILVVDDVPINLYIFVNLIKDYQMQADTASSGQECLALTKQNLYDIIFMDHMMPEMDGIETLCAIKADANNPNNDTTVIMLTANALIGMKEMYLEKGFNDYLSKPIVPDKLDKMINKYLPDDKKIVDDELSANNVTATDSLMQICNSSDTISKKPASIKEQLQTLKALIPDVDTNMAINFCAGSEKVYIEFLKDYATNGRYEKLSTAYQNMDLKNYTIEVHSLKSTSKTLGFNKLADLAEGLQLAAEQNDTEAINKTHNNMMELYKDILSSLEKIL